MDRDLLFKRLKRLRPIENTEQKKNNGKPQTQKTAAVPDEWLKTSEHLYRCETAFHPGADIEGTGGVCASGYKPGIPGACGDFDDMLFYDLETTGLSQGAGTLAFLAGFASLGADGKITQRQYFLSDYPGEPAFLNAVKKEIQNAGILVSYNGRSYDTPLLESRFALNGIPFEVPRQLDLLYLARRLWKRSIGRCSLTDVEQKVFGFTRVRDIPGRLIPRTWFNFLQSGDMESLYEVFVHHRQDIFSLIRLYALIERMISTQKPIRRGDAAALAAIIMEKDTKGGLNVLREAAEADNAARFDLALMYKKSDNIKAAIPHWEALCDTPYALKVLSELAKYHEHSTREYETALEYTEKAISRVLPFDKTSKEAYLKRKSRLLKKIQKITKKEVENG